MPETIGNENPVSPTSSSRNERTEAKFFEAVEQIIAEAIRLGAEYDPPNDIAKLVNLQAQRDAALAARTTNQANDAAEENERNQRENLFKSLNKDVSSLVGYAKSYGVETNQLAALQSIARDVRGSRATPIDPNDPNANHISVANLSYVTRADNYAQFIEQYETLAIPTNEDQFKVATHRTKLDALRQSTNDVINAQSASNTSGEQLDKHAYTDADSLLNACLSAKAYIKSKYGTNGQPYLNISKTRFRLPSRLRRR